MSIFLRNFLNDVRITSMRIPWEMTKIRSYEQSHPHKQGIFKKFFPSLEPESCIVLQQYRLHGTRT